MLFRTTPKYFNKVVRSFNRKQKKAVVELGFGALLNLNLDYMPGKLAYWLASYYNPLKGSLPLHTGDGEHIDEEDVHLTLGFPKGRVLIHRKSRQTTLALMDDIAAKLTKKRQYLKPEDIESIMMNEVDGGDYFKQLFLLLVEYCFIEAPADGFMRPKILHLIEDVSNVHNYDWCGYLLSVLLTAHDRWLKSKSRYYTGPIVFLVACYVDRMILGRRVVERRFPTISTWNMSNLKKRQEIEIAAGGFGRGFYGGRMKQDDVDHDKALLRRFEQKILEEEDCSDIPDISLEGFETMSQADIKNKAMNELYESGVKMAKSIGDFVDKLNTAPSIIRDLRCFKLASTTGLSLVGLARAATVGKDETVATLTQAMEDEEFDNPEWVAALETMMSAFEKKYAWDNYQPNFDLFGDFDNNQV